MNLLRRPRFISAFMVLALLALSGLFLKAKLEQGNFRLSFFNIEYEEPAEAAKRTAAFPQTGASSQGVQIEDKGRFIMERPVVFSNLNTGFGTYVEGTGTVAVYERGLEILLKETTLHRNPRYQQEEPIIYVASVEIELATWTNQKQDRWTTVASSNRIPIKQALSNTNTSLQLAGVTFSIPFRAPITIEDHWLVMSIIAPASESPTGEAYYYAHSPTTLFN